MSHLVFFTTLQIENVRNNLIVVKGGGGQGVDGGGGGHPVCSRHRVLGQLLQKLLLKLCRKLKAKNTSKMFFLD